MSIDGLHQPSSASTSAPPPSSNSSTPPTIHSEASRLSSLKDNIETRLDVYYDVLKTNNVTMATPLVDPEGFPRADIDVAGVRTARVQVIRLKNDLKEVMEEMSRLLERGLPKGTGSEVMEAEIEVEKEAEKPEDKAFARVDGVFPGSPAATAGLLRGDQIVSFGSVNFSNHDTLKGLAALVGQSEGTILPIVILRPFSETNEAVSRLHLRLTPRTGWGGRGMLGCHVVPL